MVSSVAAGLLLLVPAFAAAQAMDANAVMASIDQKGAVYRDVAMKIWSFAEVAVLSRRQGPVAGRDR